MNKGICSEEPVEMSKFVVFVIILVPLCCHFEVVIGFSNFKCNSYIAFMKMLVATQIHRSYF